MCQCNLFICFFLFFHQTSFVRNSFIRYPFPANSDSISTRIPRRAQWRNTIPLILTAEINYSLFWLTRLFKNPGCYILPSLKDFVPEISKLRRMYILPSKQPSTQPSNTTSIVLIKFLMLYEHMQEVCVYVPYLMQNQAVY